jgi:hypothetical protein
MKHYYPTAVASREYGLLKTKPSQLTSNSDTKHTHPGITAGNAIVREPKAVITDALTA